MGKTRHRTDRGAKSKNSHTRTVWKEAERATSKQPKEQGKVEGKSGIESTSGQSSSAELDSTNRPETNTSK